MKHHVAPPAPGNIRQVLREDPALRAVYRAKTPADLNALLAGMTAAQRQALLEGLARLAWVTLRRL
jgi:hypothetical protein